MEENKKIYFLSDFHLGAPNRAASLAREIKIVNFLDEIKHNASEIFILGDLFDFWFEYKYVVPKGYVRILGKLAALTDAGIKITFFVGNHDMWMKDYFLQELNIPVFFEPKEFVLNNKVFLIGHGDGLGPGDYNYKLLKKIFRNPLCQFLFGILPPQIGMGLANFFSRKSRAKTGNNDQIFESVEKEWLASYCKEQLEKKHYDFFIFGHRHLPLDIQLNEKSRYINSGDWLKYNSFLVFENQNIELKYYNK